MNYTRNWNSEFILSTNGFKNLDLCIEIGCFEGLTSNYIVDNLLEKKNGHLICIDPLSNNYLNSNLTENDVKNNQTIYNYFNNQYERFIENVNNNIQSGKITLMRNNSENALEILLENGYSGKVDFIYIDGDHRASAVYNDGKLSFDLCKTNGFILFDDYTWGSQNDEQSTKNGIDKFLEDFLGKYEIIKKGYQILIKKL